MAADPGQALAETVEDLINLLIARGVIGPGELEALAQSREALRRQRERKAGRRGSGGLRYRHVPQLAQEDAMRALIVAALTIAMIAASAAAALASTSGFYYHG